MSNLREASFRGVAFDVSKTTLKVGRRVVVFEYPQQDKPFVEDLGKSARTITMTASVSGPDYISRMKRLIAACEKEGKGRLIDPWLGAMTVFPKSLSAPSFSSLNYADITLEFVECGEYKFPTGLLNTSALSKALSDTFGSSSLTNFLDKFDSLTLSETAQKILGSELTDTLNKIPIDNIFEIGDGVADLAGDVSALIEGGASAIGQRVLDAFGLSGYASSVANWASTATNLVSLCKSGALTQAITDTIGYSENTITSVAEAHAEIQSLIRRTAVADLILASSVVGTELDKISESAAETVMAYDDMIAIRSDVLEVLDAEMLLCDSDDLFQVLVQARSAVYQDMTERAEGMAKLVTFTPPEIMPALVLAYDYYGDASRDSEIIERNNVKHGGFVPSEPLKMLNE
jgi:prophage DNA circulation protein